MKKIKVVWCAVSIAVMALIFFFSHQTAEVSSDTSGGLAQILARFLGAVFRGGAYERVLWFAQWIVRKSAHFILFAFLGICVYKSLDLGTRKKRFFIALTVCVMYAVGDEIHQIFIAGRACRIGDIFIDGAGSATGIATIQCVKGAIHTPKV